MIKYSKSDDELPHENPEFDSRLECFFNGDPIPPKDAVDFDVGSRIEEFRLRDIEQFEIAMSALDDLDCESPADMITAKFYTCAYDPDEEPVDRIYEAPTMVSRYDKCFARVRALEAQLEKANPNDAPRVAADLKAANAAWDIEKERGLNDRFRKFHLIDGWRSGEGRDGYNTARRTKRSEPNTILQGMSEEERKEHKRALGRNREWKRSKKKAGWSDDQIENGLRERLVLKQA
ncbi:hypothetical protein PEL8287_03387 [Roseovarius litorisediminis]|uniref:Uncharacterized protein n=1 Tax=Roseovarius litorisediminis TaxID=1312363 RepID=A0A1Y5TEC6_9RHOB|nr:hypothetical protein [Roseovarius litorisediminis]SLN62202.1 hypothetical protein PEL8287_03387 [Roseovarius litorisediminis]